METIGTKEAAKQLGLSVARIGQLLNKGKIVGAYLDNGKEGFGWRIPTPIQRLVGKPGRPRNPPGEGTYGGRGLQNAASEASSTSTSNEPDFTLSDSESTA